MSPAILRFRYAHFCLVAILYILPSASKPLAAYASYPPLAAYASYYNVSRRHQDRWREQHKLQMKTVREEVKRFRQLHKGDIDNCQPVPRMQKTFEYTKEQLYLIRDGQGHQVPVPQLPVVDDVVDDDFDALCEAEESLEIAVQSDAGQECPWQEELQLCLGMGFNELQSVQVLQMTAGNVEQAISLLADPAYLQESKAQNSSSETLRRKKRRAERKSLEQVAEQEEEMAAEAPSLQEVVRPPAPKPSPSSKPKDTNKKKQNQSKKKTDNSKERKSQLSLMDQSHAWILPGFGVLMLVFTFVVVFQL